MSRIRRLGFIYFFQIEVLFKLPHILKRKLGTVAWITLVWTCLSMVQLGYEISIITEYGLDYRWSKPNNFSTYFLINTLAFIVNGLVAGVMIVFFLQNWIRNRPYGIGLFYSIGSYTILFVVLTCVQNYFVTRSMWDGVSTFYPFYLKGLRDYFLSHEFLRMFVFWLVILSGTIITLFINDKYGPGELKKFLIGRYFRPRDEHRIFMFLDLKGSTTIAESLGEQKYFQFIQRVFKDVTPVLLDTKGQVYQYVGDEIVITWDIRTGLKGLNCVNCFLGIRELLAGLGDSYMKDYGVLPEFKAGLHTGRVMGRGGWSH